MVSRVVGDALVHREAIGSWTVTTIEYPEGSAEISQRALLTQVVVGDRAAGGASTGATCYAAAACTVDGELLVAVKAAPPAIVVTPSGCRTRPAEGDGHDSEFPDSRQRLILLSCSAFEAVPGILCEEARSTPSRLALEDPERLLIAILGPAGRGAGAVIDHH